MERETILDSKSYSKILIDRIWQATGRSELAYMLGKRVRVAAAEAPNNY